MAGRDLIQGVWIGCFSGGMGSTGFGSPRLRFLLLGFEVSGFADNSAVKGKPQLLGFVATWFGKLTHDSSLGRINGVATMLRVGKARALEDEQHVSECL